MNKTRPIRIQFRVTPEELRMIEQKQAESKIISREVFLRKLVLEGKILMLDIPEMREISALLGRCAGSLNQIAKRVNITGRLYENDLKETKACLEQINGRITSGLSEFVRSPGLHGMIFSIEKYSK